MWEFYLSQCIYFQTFKNEAIGVSASLRGKCQSENQPCKGTEKLNSFEKKIISIYLIPQNRRVDLCSTFWARQIQLFHDFWDISFFAIFCTYDTIPIIRLMEKSCTAQGAKKVLARFVPSTVCTVLRITARLCLLLLLCFVRCVVTLVEQPVSTLMIYFPYMAWLAKTISGFLPWLKTNLFFTQLDLRFYDVFANWHFSITPQNVKLSYMASYGHRNMKPTVVFGTALGA